jgi:hypothetical protein
MTEAIFHVTHFERKRFPRFTLLVVFLTLPVQSTARIRSRKREPHEKVSQNVSRRASLPTDTSCFQHQKVILIAYDGGKLAVMMARQASRTLQSSTFSASSFFRPVMQTNDFRFSIFLDADDSQTMNIEQTFLAGSFGSIRSDAAKC